MSAGGSRLFKGWKSGSVDNELHFCQNRENEFFSINH